MQDKLQKLGGNFTGSSEGRNLLCLAKRPNQIPSIPHPPNVLGKWKFENRQAVGWPGRISAPYQLFFVPVGFQRLHQAGSQWRFLILAQATENGEWSLQFLTASPLLRQIHLQKDQVTSKPVPPYFSNAGEFQC